MIKDVRDVRDVRDLRDTINEKFNKGNMCYRKRSRGFFSELFYHQIRHRSGSYRGFQRRATSSNEHTWENH